MKLWLYLYLSVDEKPDVPVPVTKVQNRYRLGVSHAYHAI
jgi:hypothetical protein